MTTKITKRDLEAEIKSLKTQLKAIRNTVGELQPSQFVEYIPCGKIQEVWGHAFEEEIRDAVCNQFDGSVGWIRIQFDGGEFPFENILCNVSYTKEDGTFVSKFCPLAKMVRDYDYDQQCFSEWKAG